MRFTKKDENSLSQIKAEIEFLLYLSDNKFPSVNLIKSINNNYVEIVEKDSETYYAVAFDNTDGIYLDIETITKDQLECWGKSLASLHSLSRSYKPKKYVRQSWKDMLKYAADILSNYPNETDALKELDRVEKWLNSLPITDDNYGLIHYDYELDNVFFNKQSNKFVAIDFDDCVYHWYVMDIVCALGDLYELEDSKLKAGLQAFLKGYRCIMNIDDEYIELIPKFKRFDNLKDFVNLLRALKDSNFSQEPDWLIKLRPRLLKVCDECREVFKEEW